MASQTLYPSKITLTFVTITIFFISSVSSSTSSRISKIYAFGDSYTDTGNTRSRPPYGITFFRHPANRFSDGRLVIDFVTETLSLPYLPPYIDRKADLSHGVNFAVAGSTAIDHDFFVKRNITLSFTDQSIHTQLASFNKFLESRGCRGTISQRECEAVMDGALFWVGEIGANDYAYIVGSSVSSSTVQSLAITSVNDFLEALLKMGAKRIVVQGLPMIGCLSLALTLAETNDRDDFGCVASANKESYTHNSLLQARIQDLRRRYPHAIISYADYWNAYLTVMKNKQRYGFTEPFKACCGSSGGPYNFDFSAFCGSQSASRPCSNPAQFINWDGVHLTEAMYKVNADLFLHRGYCHPSFDIFLSTKGSAD